MSRVNLIIDLLKSGHSFREIAEKAHCSESYVRSVKSVHRVSNHDILSQIDQNIERIDRNIANGARKS